MEVSPPCNGGPSELLVRRLGSKKIYASRNQRGNRNSDTEESLIAKFGNALRAFLHVKDAQQQFSDCKSLPSKDTVLQYPDSNILPSKDAQLQFPDINILPSEDAQLQCTLSAEFNLDQPKLCEDAQLQCTLSAEFNLDQPKLSTTPPIEDILNKHGGEDCAEITPLMILSENAPSMVVSVEEEEEEILDSVSLLPSEEHSGGLVCEPQPSLPVALVPTKELISAMKGTREKLGIMPLTKLTVTWSPDVYDPPVTSVTHTVTGRNHHHRSRSKKTNTTSKRHKGGKSSQGSSSSSKRHHKHASKSDHHHCSKSSSSSSSSSPPSSPPSSSSSSSPVSTSERSVFGCYESMLDDLDLESSCGSSFLGKSVAEVLAPFAEAK